MSRLEIALAAVVIFISTENVRSQCSAPQCDPSYFPEQLTISPDQECYNDGQDVTLTCAGNLGGPPFNTCNSGSWLYPPSTCEVFTCERPDLGAELQVTPDKATYDAREAITYSCTQEYRLTGATTAVCDSQNIWNPSTVPTCIQSCDPPNIPNGGLTTDGPFNTGDTAEVECDEGYDLAPGSSSTLTCSNGGWDSIPTCYARCNVTGTDFSDTPDTVVINHGGSKTITCNSGYSYQQQTAFEVECNDGTVEGVKPSTCYADCEKLTAPSNGVVSGGIMDGQTVTFECNRGYATNDSTTDTCRNGAWENNITTPTCYAKSLEESIALYCNPDKYVIEMPAELLSTPSDLTTLQLGTCDADYYDGAYVYTNSSYMDCGTTYEIDTVARQIIYQNTVFTVDSGIITTDTAVTIDVACVFDQDNLVSSIAIIQSGLSSSLEQGGKYAMDFIPYTDNTYATEITENDRVEPAQTIYLRAVLDYVSSVDLFPTRCYATPEPASDYYRYKDLITEGCPSAESTYASDLRTDTSTKENFGFALEVFRFTDSDSIYIHCELKICPIPPGDSSACPLPASCSAARRRRASRLTITRHVSAGPIRVGREHDATGDDNTDADGWEKAALVVYSVTVSAVLLAVLAIVLVVFYRRSKPYSELKQPLENSDTLS